MTAQSFTFADEKRLLIRLAGAVRKGEKVTFLVGSPLSMPGPEPDERGVPGVTGIIQRVRAAVADTADLALLDEELDGGSPSERYQKAMRFVLECLGQDELNRIVREAVLEARVVQPKECDERTCERLEDDVGGWALRPGAIALGELLVGWRDVFTGPVLTSNFDPLIRAGIHRAGGHGASIFLSSDGRFDNVRGRNTHNIVHFHGYWLGSDTLHTPGQLMRERSQLKGCLRTLLRDTILIVLAYGGWNDVFTRTLVEVVKEGGENFNVLWTFFSNDELQIQRENVSLLQWLGSAQEQRVIFYKGIDCHVFLPNLVRRLKSVGDSTQPGARTDSTESRSQFPADASRDAVASGFTHVPVQRLGVDLNQGSSTTKMDDLRCDPLPNVDIWVGREEELERLADPEIRVVAITGIGGQGKSGLAAHFLKEIDRGLIAFDFWDWRDCREEGDTIHTQVVSIIERLTGGALRGSQMVGETLESIVQTLFKVLGLRRGVFVFDNVDNYIDLETFQPVSGLKTIFDAALTFSHNSKFIFTCRPAIHDSALRFVQIRLSGLNRAQTQRLFERRGVTVDVGVSRQAIDQAYELTNGHPMWLNLLAAQTSRDKKTFTEIMRSIPQGRITVDLPDKLLKSMWITLNERQRLILRCMSETMRPETEDRLSRFIAKDLNSNQFSRHLRTLITLNLVEVKSTPNALDMLDLHPLIREFVKREYPRHARKRFIVPIVGFYNNRILKLKPSLSSISPLSVLENWTQKAELDMNRGYYLDALQTLDEVSEALLAGGYPEEYLRVTTRLFSEMDWSEAILEEYQGFDEVLKTMVKTLSELGRRTDADRFLEKYANVIPGKSARYINYCELRCYALWCSGEFSAAIQWGERGDELVRRDNPDTKFNLTYTLALARRDGGQIDQALVDFLDGAPLESLLAVAPASESRSAEDYGNIGRCLFLKGDRQSALICYRRSATLLEKEEHSGVITNRGYAYFWIGEALEAEHHCDLAYCFYRMALKRWLVMSPPNAQMVEERIGRLVEHMANFAVSSQTDWEIEKRCRKWLDE